MAQKQQDHHLYFEGKVQTEGYFSQNEVKYIDVYISYGPFTPSTSTSDSPPFLALEKKQKNNPL